MIFFTDAELVAKDIEADVFIINSKHQPIELK